MKKFVAIFVLVIFTLNNCYAFALSPVVTSNEMGEDSTVKGDMYAAAGKLFAVKRGPGFLSDLGGNMPRSFSGKEFVEITRTGSSIKEIYDVKPAEKNDKSLPEGWENNPLLQKKDLIEALEYYRDNEACIPQDILEIVEGSFDVDKDSGEVPIARIEKKKGQEEKYRLVVHRDFMRMWNHIRENDVLFTMNIMTSSGHLERRTVSVAWGIFYRLAKHEMGDISQKTKGLKSKGHINSAGPQDEAGGVGISIEPDEIKTSKIKGQYATVNDAIWLWFLGSYVVGDTVRYDNDVFIDRINWIMFGEYAEKLGLKEEFPRFSGNHMILKVGTAFAAWINYQFFSRGSIAVPEHQGPVPADAGNGTVEEEAAEVLAYAAGTEHSEIRDRMLARFPALSGADKDIMDVAEFLYQQKELEVFYDAAEVSVPDADTLIMKIDDFFDTGRAFICQIARIQGENFFPSFKVSMMSSLRDNKVEGAKVFLEDSQSDLTIFKSAVQRSVTGCSSSNGRWLVWHRHPEIMRDYPQLRKVDYVIVDGIAALLEDKEISLFDVEMEVDPIGRSVTIEIYNPLIREVKDSIKVRIARVVGENEYVIERSRNMTNFFPWHVYDKTTIAVKTKEAFDDLRVKHIAGWNDWVDSFGFKGQVARLYTYVSKSPQARNLASTKGLYDLVGDMAKTAGLTEEQTLMLQAAALADDLSKLYPNVLEKSRFDALMQVVEARAPEKGIEKIKANDIIAKAIATLNAEQEYSIETLIERCCDVWSGEMNYKMRKMWPDGEGEFTGEEEGVSIKKMPFVDQEKDRMIVEMIAAHELVSAQRLKKKFPGIPTEVITMVSTHHSVNVLPMFADMYKVDSKNAELDFLLSFLRTAQTFYAGEHYFRQTPEQSLDYLFDESLMREELNEKAVLAGAAHFGLKESAEKKFGVRASIAEQGLWHILSSYAIRTADKGNPDPADNTAFGEHDKALGFSVQLLHNTPMEIFIPQSMKLSREMKDALGRLRAEMKKNNVNIAITRYSLGNLDDMESAATLKDERTKRIMITDGYMSSVISEMLDKDLRMAGSFRNIRIIGVDIPVTLSGDKRTVLQAKSIMAAILGRLLDSSSEHNIYVRDMLKRILSGAFPGDDSDIEEYMDRLEKDDTDQELSGLVDRVLYFTSLNRMIRFVEELGRELRIVKKFWTYA